MLDELKRSVLQLARRCETRGLCLPRSGNFSMRDPDTGLVAVTPSALDRMSGDLSDICIVDLSGKAIEVKEGLKPTSEIQLHLRVYELRPDIRAVIHTHSRYATTLAILRREIPPVVYEVMYYGGKVPLAPYGRPGTSELADSVNGIIPHNDVCLLTAHGMLSTGADAESAFIKALYVEESATLYYLALVANGGKEPPTLPMEELEAWQYPEDFVHK